MIVYNHDYFFWMALLASLGTLLSLVFMILALKRIQWVIKEQIPDYFMLSSVVKVILFLLNALAMVLLFINCYSKLHTTLQFAVPISYIVGLFAKTVVSIIFLYAFALAGSHAFNNMRGRLRISDLVFVILCFAGFCVCFILAAFFMYEQLLPVLAGESPR